jgi:hypothetical protein
MKRLSFYFALTLGLFAIYIEFISIKGWSIFGGDLLDYLPLLFLCIAGILFLLKDRKLFSRSKNVVSFLPSITCFLIVVIVVAHIMFRLESIKSKTNFTAYNYQLSGEGFSLEFKENGYVKGILVRKFSEDFFWGTYRKVGDTIHLNMRTNINLGDLAVIKNDTMKMVGTSIYFLTEQNSRR